MNMNPKYWFGKTLIDSCFSKISPGNRVELILQVTLNMERNRAKAGTHLTWVRHCAKQRGGVKREFYIIEHIPYPKVTYILVLKARLIKIWAYNAIWWMQNNWHEWEMFSYMYKIGCKTLKQWMKGGNREYYSTLCIS